jgi:hypothetical protein
MIGIPARIAGHDGSLGELLVADFSGYFAARTKDFQNPAYFK